MKAALLISGYLRSFKLNIPSIREKIINSFEKVDVYIHITKNEHRDDKYFNTINESEDIEYIKKTLNPVVLIEEPNVVKFTIKDKNDVFNLWSKFYKLNTIKKINEEIFGKYDIVVKYRPDLCITTKTNIFSKKIEQNTIYIPQKSVMDITKLIQPNDPYICDVLAYGDTNIMNTYFDIYSNIEQLSEQYGAVSETILYHYLNKNNIKYKLRNINYNILLSTCNVFAICGDSGSGKTTLSNILKQFFKNSFTLECDRYHKWERNSKNWKSITHLNPKANYITKMNKDIFDLKIGKDIYHVNYDHSSGKFTEKEQIEKNDNIIVCGLHSLYHANDSIYNLKIFLDPDTKLKTQWKITRDIKERGYTKNSILKLIKKREKDYFKYVYPQREQSDIIINFCLNKQTCNSLDKKNNIQLRLYIKKKYTLSDILGTLINHKIEFDTDFNINQTFNIITFKNFKRTKLLNGFNIKQNNYYDYIIFFILNLKKDL